MIACLSSDQPVIFVVSWGIMLPESIVRTLRRDDSKEETDLPLAIVSLYTIFCRNSIWSWNWCVSAGPQTILQEWPVNFPNDIAAYDRRIPARAILFLKIRLDSTARMRYDKSDCFTAGRYARKGRRITWIKAARI